jgi:hypothetical protein
VRTLDHWSAGFQAETLEPLVATIMTLLAEIIAQIRLDRAASLLPSEPEQTE